MNCALTVDAFGKKKHNI